MGKREVALANFTCLALLLGFHAALYPALAEVFSAYHS